MDIRSITKGKNRYELPQSIIKLVVDNQDNPYKWVCSEISDTQFPILRGEQEHMSHIKGGEGSSDFHRMD